ncbi:NADPH-dependent F420 reductase [Thalassococcus sp. S3]|uniref:NADPH-dependent F420 reductase n=1 Tax=Thalassococcus sp. S3 TaxID=2017482 RepID=UPI00102444DD|nr:hypothetical protein CFI11_11360 [Thalassococcus sp. S3]
MKIGIIGAGDIGKLYGQLWREAGHDIMIASRSSETREDAARKIGATAGTPEDAAAFGDVILLAVNYATVDEAVSAIAPAIDGKLVIDATNPLIRVSGGGVERVIPDDAISGEIMAHKLPGARVAKGFTTLWTGHVEEKSDRDAPKVAMTLAADAAEDREIVAKLISDAGLVPVDLGTLAQSRPLDPPSPIWNVVLSADELAERVAVFRQEQVA